MNEKELNLLKKLFRIDFQKRIYPLKVCHFLEKELIFYFLEEENGIFLPKTANSLSKKYKTEIPNVIKKKFFIFFKR